MENIITKLISILVILFSSNAIQAQRPGYPAKPPVEEWRYEDSYTFKYGEPFQVDPWTWGYTKEFADRFRMPAKWIEPQMAGVLAVAFRVGQTGNKDICGLGGREDNCWPQVGCIFDIYYDTSIPLPWGAETQVRDYLAISHTSMSYTYGAHKRLQERTKSGFRPDAPNTNHNTQGPAILRIGISQNEGRIGVADKVGNDWQYSVGFLYYDREFAPGIGLLGVTNGDCAYPFFNSDYFIHFFRNKESQEISYRLPREQLKNIGMFHEALLPKNMMERFEQARIKAQKNNEDVMNGLINQFKSSKKH